MTYRHLVRTVAYCLAAFLIAPLAHAQTSPAAQILVTAPINEAKMVTLPGNLRREANAANDRGKVSDSMPLEHMQLLLNRPADREAALAALIEALHQPGSPLFHRWLTPEQFGDLFGPHQSDIRTVCNWLESQGFQVNDVSKSGLAIDFSGTANQINATFRTEIHTLQVNGTKHIANMQNPQIPAALAGIINGVASLNDFRPHPANKGIISAHVDPTSGAIVRQNAAQAASPSLTASADYQLVVPDDLHTIYNFKPVYKNNITGKGQTIVIIEDTDVYSTNDWTVFRDTFGLSKYRGASFTQIHPGRNCQDPGINGDDGEAILDAEYASAAAPSADIVLASCANTQTTFGGLLAVQALIDRPFPPSIISISYGECEAGLGSAGNAAYKFTYQQAAVEGVSVFVSTGDEGAASCDANEPAATLGISVSGFASTPYNVAVGGTDFGDTYAGTNTQYWKNNNSPTFGSAKSYIPEIPWTDSCASSLLTNFAGYAVPYGSSGFCNSTVGEQFLTTSSGSGGPSACAYGNTSPLDGTPAVSGTCQGYAKPSYQRGAFGNPSDGVRDLPDVSLFAANGLWGHYYAFCYTDPTPKAGGAPCTGNPENWSGAGGTSFAAPIVAGIQALINQSTGGTQGNPNYVYYALAKQEFGGRGNNSCNSTLGNGVADSCTFYDITQGDMDINCVGTFNCFDPSGPNGVLSVSSTAYKPAYGSTPGWDFATGIGTLNVNNLVKNWNKAFFFFPFF